MNQADLLPDLIGNKELVYSSFRLSENELAPIGTPSFAEWVEVGRFIQNAENAVQFWIGDWLIYGEKTYGKAHYRQALQETGLSYQTLRDYKWVASAVPVQLRTEKLGYHHHRQVANLPLETQARLLTQAQEEAWPLVKLKQEKFRLSHPVLPTPPAAHPDFLLGDCASLLATVPDASLDLLVTDPPYGIEYETEHREVNPFWKFKNDRLEDLLPLLDRVFSLLVALRFRSLHMGAESQRAALSKSRNFHLLSAASCRAVATRTRSSCVTSTAARSSLLRAEGGGCVRARFKAQSDTQRPAQ